jgi:erythromycin esterase-like protein
VSDDAARDGLDEHDPEAAEVAREFYGCLIPYERRPARRET